MIVEVKQPFNVNNETYFISSSKHSQEVIRDYKRDNIKKFLLLGLTNKLLKGIKIKDGKLAVIWKIKSNYNGILFSFNNKNIKIITTIIGQKKKSPDKLFPNIENRIQKEGI